MLSGLSVSCRSSHFLVVPFSFARCVFSTLLTTELMSRDQDRENEARFGATPVPGKIGMAMAGQGLHAQPPPRPAAHNIYGGGQNPGNQLYVGNVSE